jgi:hypothetical protein
MTSIEGGNSWSDVLMWGRRTDPGEPTVLGIK